MVGAGEAGDVAGVAEDLGCEDVADAEDVGEGAARRRDGLLAATAVFEQGAIEAADVSDQLPGDRLALEINGACGPNRGQQARGPIGRELPRGAARA